MEARKDPFPFAPKGSEAGGGPVSPKISPDTIRRAEDLERKGVSPNEIMLDTGIYRLPNSPAGRGGVWHTTPESQRFVDPSFLGPRSEAPTDKSKTVFSAQPWSPPPLPIGPPQFSPGGVPPTAPPSPRQPFPGIGPGSPGRIGSVEQVVKSLYG